MSEWFGQKRVRKVKAAVFACNLPWVALALHIDGQGAEYQIPVLV
jgi:hypothetical protein